MSIIMAGNYGIRICILLFCLADEYNWTKVTRRKNCLKKKSIGVWLDIAEKLELLSHWIKLWANLNFDILQ